MSTTDGWCSVPSSDAEYDYSEYILVPAGAYLGILPGSFLVDECGIFTSSDRRVTRSRTISSYCCSVLPAKSPGAHDTCSSLLYFIFFYLF